MTYLPRPWILPVGSLGSAFEPCLVLTSLWVSLTGYTRATVKLYRWASLRALEVSPAV
jgi:hypothetical protein